MLPPGYRKQGWLAVSFIVWTAMLYLDKLTPDAYAMLMMPTMVAFIGANVAQKKGGNVSNTSG